MQLPIVLLMSVVFGIQCLSATTAFQIDTGRSAPRSGVPGDIDVRYSREQDSAYKQALSTNISAQSRFDFESRSVSEVLRTIASIAITPTPWENIQRNLEIPSEMLAPSPQEITQYKLAIANSQYVPGVLLYPMGTGNFTATFADIARVLGLAEDVSPSIAYSVDETMEVSIVVYSASAILVRTIFRGVQARGSYRLEWDGKSDNSKTVPRGDYIVEVQLGNKRIVRKRIVVPFQ